MKKSHQQDSRRRALRRWLRLCRVRKGHVFATKREPLS
jgi:hypothetical protein